MSAIRPVPQINLVALATTSVFDSEGDAAVLGKFWSNQKAVLVFLPPLGTKAARIRTGKVGEHLGMLRSLGAEVYLLGPGKFEHAEPFEEDLKPGCSLYMDPERHAYRAAAMRKDEKGVVHSTRFLNSIKNLLGASPEDLNQGVEFGGVLVVTPPGRVVFSYAATNLDDALPLQEAHLALKNAGWSHLA